MNFLWNVFFISRNLYFFFGNWQKSNARAGQQKNTCFFVNVRPKSNARAHLKQRKNHSGLRALMSTAVVLLWFRALMSAAVMFQWFRAHMSSTVVFLWFRALMSTAVMFLWGSGGLQH